MINLRSLDLNLLLVFDAIHGEGSISKAAHKLHLSQPAVSNALARLRERLGDPLFERHARGMQPTPRAKLLAGPVRQALTTLERGLRQDDAFDASRSEREFVIALEDYGEAVILPGFVRWLAEAAPGVRLRIRPEASAQLEAELREGTVDLALGYFALPGAGWHNRCVLTERLTTLARRDHPRVGQPLTLAQYLGLSHVVLAAPANARPMIDLALAKRGLQRRIAVAVPHFLSMPMLVSGSDLLCTLPERMGLLWADAFGLSAHALPLRTPRFPLYLIWHESLETDPGHQWLRSALAEFCDGLSPGD